MKFDPIILRMVPGDVSIVISDVVRAHLTCECVDRRDIQAWADHLGDKVTEMLEADPDVDGSYERFAEEIFRS